MSRINRDDLELLAGACRQALLEMADKPGSKLEGFPRGSCGLSADIVGRLAWEAFQYPGVYVLASDHPAHAGEPDHAWFEVGNYIIDITHDQYAATGLGGWVFERGTGWHAQFAEQETRDGFCPPENWPDYPYVGYEAARAAVAAAAGLGKA